MVGINVDSSGKIHSPTSTPYKKGRINFLNDIHETPKMLALEEKPSMDLM